MSNEKQSQASKLMVVAKDNLKPDANKSFLFTKLKKQIQQKHLPKNSYPYNRRVEVKHTARNQYFEFSPKWTDEKMTFGMILDD